MLIDDIFEQSKKNKVFVYFDMDGVVAEYDTHNGRPKEKIAGFFRNKRPVKTMVDIMYVLTLSKNITVGIMSNCYDEAQKADKIDWLGRNIPFLKPENIHIIMLDYADYTRETKDQLKGQYISTLHAKNKNEKIYLIEDDLDIIHTINDHFANIQAEHLSCLLN